MNTHDFSPTLAVWYFLYIRDCGSPLLNLNRRSGELVAQKLLETIHAAAATLPAFQPFFNELLSVSATQLFDRKTTLVQQLLVKVVLMLTNESRINRFWDERKKRDEILAFRAFLHRSRCTTVRYLDVDAIDNFLVQVRLNSPSIEHMAT